MHNFSGRIAFSFAVCFLMLLTFAVLIDQTTQSFTRTSYAVTRSHQILEKIAGIDSALKDAETGQRGYLLTGKDSYLEPHRSAVANLPKLCDSLRQLSQDDPEAQKQMDELQSLSVAKLAELEQTIELRRSGDLPGALKVVDTEHGKQYMDGMRAILERMEKTARSQLDQRAQKVQRASRAVSQTLEWGLLVCLGIILIFWHLLTRLLGQQIARTTRRVRTCSAELQTAANQQMTGSRQSATAMSEITTTMNELLATSRQIAESARQVSHVASQTADRARQGEEKVYQATTSMDSIRRQMDQVIAHMMDLGKKSQMVGELPKLWVNWPNKRTSWPSMPPSKRPAPANPANALAW